MTVMSLYIGTSTAGGCTFDGHKGYQVPEYGVEIKNKPISRQQMHGEVNEIRQRSIQV